MKSYTTCPTAVAGARARRGVLNRRASVRECRTPACRWRGIRGTDCTLSSSAGRAAIGRTDKMARGLTMWEASRVCGFSGEVGLLSGIESGEITKTTSKCVALICDAYGVARADAFGLIVHWSPGMDVARFWPQGVRQ